jgi:hypothetical protein
LSLESVYVTGNVTLSASPYVSFKVLAAVLMKCQFFWDVTLHHISELKSQLLVHLSYKTACFDHFGQHQAMTCIW